MLFFPVKDQYKFLKNKIHNNLNKTLLHNKFILGPEVKKLENELKKYTKSKYCITTSSCTDSLLMSLMSININPGDEVITSAFTYISSIEVICLLGAKPILVDVDKKTANIDHKKLNKKINSKTKAIIVTSLYGNMANYDEINKLAKKNKIVVIEDAAQSFGSKYKNLRSCNVSEIGCTSFFPTKILSCYGDAGAIFTNNKKIATKLKEIRSHGQNKKYNHKSLGLCARMDTLQASILLAKLSNFQNELKKRKIIAKKFDSHISKLFLNNECYRIINNKDSSSNNYLYTIVVQNRKKFIYRLKESKIPYMIYYSKSLNKQTAYKKFFRNQKYENADFLSQNCISIPCHPYLNFNEQNKILSILTSISKK